MKQSERDRLRKRFEPKIIKTEGCWIWTGCRLRGYGQMSGLNRRHKVYAHRFAWEISNKREVPAGMLVMHSCDNPPCVNPAHLSIGTHKDNALDAAKKGRLASPDRTRHLGEDNVTSKLTEKQVLEIRKRIASGENMKTISRSFPVAYQTIWKISKRLIWKHVS